VNLFARLDAAIAELRASVEQVVAKEDCLVMGLPDRTADELSFLIGTVEGYVEPFTQRLLDVVDIVHATRANKSIDQRVRQAGVVTKKRQANG
jgi:hypothetical protein